MKHLIQKLQHDHPEFSYIESTRFAWSPKDRSIHFESTGNVTDASVTLLHELAHGILGHTTFTTDFELLKIEVEAWQHAMTLGEAYEVNIPDEHVQSCLDTYRDWLHIRSTCPTCECHGFQGSDLSYRCINCGSAWTVSSSRSCRPYRKKAIKKEAYIRTLLFQDQN